ncbi:hypothetical protein B0J13DRAFT_527800 [Dactylonectria estremocensis]|uniref:Uncharacterized protein n=1 Tax=Dactylonectria estremocensis TaxID=1079267 RepID=A0A9P9EFX8_9HYPO|nr:hypothetical protein B0J13DRAFT_527800 [Dactylonectria estremocensis]
MLGGGRLARGAHLASCCLLLLLLPRLLPCHQTASHRTVPPQAAEKRPAAPRLDSHSWRVNGPGNAWWHLAAATPIPAVPLKGSGERPLESWRIGGLGGTGGEGRGGQGTKNLVALAPNGAK